MHLVILFIICLISQCNLADQLPNNYNGESSSQESEEGLSFLVDAFGEPIEQIGEDTDSEVPTDKEGSGDEADANWHSSDEERYQQSVHQRNCSLDVLKTSVDNLNQIRRRRRKHAQRIDFNQLLQNYTAAYNHFSADRNNPESKKQALYLEECVKYSGRYYRSNRFDDPKEFRAIINWCKQNRQTIQNAAWRWWLDTFHFQDNSISLGRSPIGYNPKDIKTVANEFEDDIKHVTSITEQVMWLNANAEFSDSDEDPSEQALETTDSIGKVFSASEGESDWGSEKEVVYKKALEEKNNLFSQLVKQSSELARERRRRARKLKEQIWTDEKQIERSKLATKLSSSTLSKSEAKRLEELDQDCMDGAMYRNLDADDRAKLRYALNNKGVFCWNKEGRTVDRWQRSGATRVLQKDLNWLYDEFGEDSLM